MIHPQKLLGDCRERLKALPAASVHCCITSPPCTCNAHEVITGNETIPCTILDPFGGTGCTSMVATNLGRHSIYCDLNPEYFKDSAIRTAQGALL